MKKQLTIAATIALVMVTIVLSLANRQDVVVNYLFGRFRLPLILVIVGSVSVGFMIQYLLGLVKIVSLKNQLKTLRKELELVKATGSSNDDQALLP